MGSAPRRSGGVDLRLEHADIREIAVFFCVVEPVADNERVRHFKAGIGGMDRCLAAGRLIEQGGNGDGGRTADTEIVLEIVQGDALPKQVPVNIILPTYPLNHNTPVSSKGIFEQ